MHLDLKASNQNKSYTSISCLSISLISTPAKANECLENPASFSTEDCYETPDRYEIKIYELGLCTSDPLSSTNFDGSSCSATYSNSDGLTLNIAPGSQQGIKGGTTTKPAAGNYEHAYIKMANTFGLNGSYTINGTTFYSTSNGSASTSLSKGQNWTEVLYDFSGGDSCDQGDYSASETFTSGVTGTIKARLTNNSYTTVSSCPSATRLVGSFAPSSPISITNDQLGLEVNFTVTKSGMTVFRQNTSSVAQFGSGPFRARFTAY